MSYGGESFGVRPFFIVAPIVLGACLIMLFSVDERGHLGEKNSCRQFICQGVALCCVLEQDTFILVLVLVQPRKTRPDTSEKIVDWEVKNQINYQKI